MKSNRFNENQTHIIIKSYHDNSAHGPAQRPKVNNRFYFLFIRSSCFRTGDLGSKTCFTTLGRRPSLRTESDELDREVCFGLRSFLFGFIYFAWSLSLLLRDGKYSDWTNAGILGEMGCLGNLSFLSLEGVFLQSYAAGL